MKTLMAVVNLYQKTAALRYSRKTLFVQLLFFLLVVVYVVVCVFVVVVVFEWPSM